MRALLQRVSRASVSVDGAEVGAIGAGLLILICAMQGDTEAEADKLAAKIAKLRIFKDDAGKMNLSLRDVSGAALVVSQFTLAADLRGNRPGFSYASGPEDGKRLYDYFANGIAAFIQNKNAPVEGAPKLATRALNGFLSGGAVGLTAGALVGQSRELLAFMSTQDVESRSRVIAAPSIIATDSISATINVGTEVPTLASQAVTGVQSSGSSLFANTITNRQTGVTLSVTARINPSGIVTLIINQEVSAPQGASSGAIQSPSFSRRSINTQVTVEDGDTIAVGGIINESNTYSSAGFPFLHRLPVIGAAFGSRSYGKERTELVVFMTPRVIYDTNEISEASDELKGRLRRLRKYIRE